MITAIPSGSILVDTDTVIGDPATAMNLYGLGVAGVVRYLSRTSPQRAGDLSAVEMRHILCAGLGLLAVQHCPLPRRWRPTDALGAIYGVAAVTNARAIGLPPGLTIALDLETPAPSAPADVVAYVNAWVRQVRGAGYEPMLYVGPDCGLDAAALYWDLSVKLYWRSASDVPEVAVRGYAMRQSLPTVLAGITVDRNVVVPDAFGAVPHWLIGEAIA